MSQPTLRSGPALKVGGIYPMLYAFFTADGVLDREAMRRQVEGCVADGAHGLAALGLATEVGKLSLAERHQVLEWLAEDLGGRLPFTVTVAETSISAQIEFVRAAAAAGASWVILQPPPVRGLPELDYLRFFGAVADAADIPVAIQNAPEYIGIGVSTDGLLALARNHPNFRLLKGEAPALVIARTIEQLGGQLAVFNGRAGLELTDNLRAGCAGMIPGSETVDLQVQIFELFRSSEPDAETKAEELYRECLPLIVFLIQSIENFLCYGKRLAAKRFAIPHVFDRAPTQVPTPFGLACLERAADRLAKHRRFIRSLAASV